LASSVPVAFPRLVSINLPTVFVSMMSPHPKFDLELIIMLAVPLVARHTQKSHNVSLELFIVDPCLEITALSARRR
jgi:hypothetical protein